MKSASKIISVLSALLLLPSLLFASKVLTHSVDVQSDRVDLILTFDAPHKGSLRKARKNSQIIISFDDALIAAAKSSDIASPLLSKVTFSPTPRGTKLIADVPASVRMQAAKSPDGHRIRLRFEKPGAAASRAAALAAAAAAAPSAKTALPAPKAATLRSYNTTYYLAIALLTVLLLLLLWRERRKKRTRAATWARARFYAAMRRKINGMPPRILKSVKLKRKIGKEAAETPFRSWFSRTKKEGGAAPSRLQRILNPRNKLVLTGVGIVVVMLLLPKINLYYQFEHEIKPYGIILSDEQLDDRGLWLNVKDATLYVKEIESAHAQNIDVLLLGLYNRIEFKKIALSSTFEQFVPTDIERLRVLYSVVDPLHVTVEAVGDFGTARARASLYERTVTVTLQPSKLMKTRFRSTLNKLKKAETGGYLYESRF